MGTSGGSGSPVVNQNARVMKYGRLGSPTYNQIITPGAQKSFKFGLLNSLEHYRGEVYVRGVILQVKNVYQMERVIGSTLVDDPQMPTLLAQATQTLLPR